MTAAGIFELTRADAWIAAGLATPTLDALLGDDRRHAHIAPGDLAVGPTPDPWAATGGIGDRHVVWTLLAPAEDSRAATATTSRLVASAAYTIKAVGTVDSPSDLEALADGIDAALEGRSALFGLNGLRGVSHRIGPLLYPEVPSPGDPIIWHVGGTYRLEIVT